MVCWKVQNYYGEKKEHNEQDQECWNVNSTRGSIFFNLYY